MFQVRFAQEFFAELARFGLLQHFVCSPFGEKSVCGFAKARRQTSPQPSG
jgi:hypothetical protein